MLSSFNFYDMLFLQLNNFLEVFIMFKKILEKRKNYS